MRSLEGYVFIAKVQYGKRLFGYGANPADYENFETNGLVPYANLEEAEISGRKFLKQIPDAKSVASARIKMQIAEIEEEIAEFEGEENLIAIMKGCMGDENWWRFMGPVVEGKRSFSPLPGAFLVDTDFVTFKGKTAYQNALDLVRELSRQGDRSPATLSKFELEKISTFMKKVQLTYR